MARAIHIAVNLLLIVALTMQPGLASAVQQGCSAGIVAELTCQGCGSCKVHLESAKCPCCGVGTTDEQGGCCAHGDQHTGGDSTVTSDPIAGIMPEEGPSPKYPVPENRVPQDSEQPCGDDRPQVRTVIAAVLAAGCHCVTAPEPFDAPMPHSPATELRDVLTFNVACCDDATPTSRSSLATSFDVAHRPVVAHFSQIVFCVWRL